MNVAEQFGLNLRRERERLGVSQEELSLRADVHRTEISQLERGKRVARVDTLMKLCGSLGIDSGNLLDGFSWKPGARAPGSFV